MGRRKKSTQPLSTARTNVRKDLQCSSCDRVVKVDEDVVAVTCWECAVRKCPLNTKPKVVEDTGPKKPRGWHLAKVFVDSEGNVFHEGVEKPELKGTLPPTEIKVKPKKTRAQKDEEQAKKDAKLAAKFKKKQLAKKKENEQKAAAILSTT